MRRFKEWFYNVPEGVLVVVLLIGSTAAFFEGYAILRVG